MLSYSRGPEIPLLNRTIGEQLETNADRWPDGLAVVSCHQSKRLTWSELLNAADRVAHGLARLGIEPTDRVGVWAMNCWEWLVVHMACARAGAILVNVNPSCRAHELAFILTKSRMKVLFLRERDAKANYADVLGDVCKSGHFALRQAICFDTPDLGKPVGGRAAAHDCAHRTRRRHQHSVHFRHHRFSQRRAADAPQRGQ